MSTIFSVFYRALEYTPAFIRAIHDEEMWLYKNPKSQNTISTELLFVSVILTRMKTCFVLEGYFLPFFHILYTSRGYNFFYIPSPGYFHMFGQLLHFLS